MDTEKKLLSLINSVQVLTSTLDLDEVLHQLIKEVLNVIEGSNASVLFLYDKRLNKLYPKSAVGFNMDYLQSILIDPGEGMSGQTFLSKKGRIFSSKEDTAQGMGNISPQTGELYGKALGEFEYPTSAISVPLISKDECIGVLTVDIYHKNVQFDDNDLRLLETFATQATIAIENAMLFSQNERTKKIHEKLSKVSLSHGGLTEITEALAGLVKKEVVVYNDFFDLLAYSSLEANLLANDLKANHEQALQDAIQQGEFTFTNITFSYKKKGIYFFPVQADTQRIGLIVIFVEDDSILDPLDLIAIGQANMIFALEMNRKDRLIASDFNYSGYILDQLLHQSYNERSPQQMSKLDFSKENKKFMIAQLYIKDPLIPFHEQSFMKQQLHRLIYREVSRFEYKTLVLDKNVEFTFMFVIPEHIHESDVNNRLYQLFRKIEQHSQKKIGLEHLIGLGRIVEKLENAQLSYRDARRCVQFLQLTNQTKTIFSYRQLGPYRLFLKTEKDELEEYVNDVLGPILSYDKKNQTDLLKTLKVYLETNQKMASSGIKLFVHSNTIKYRLKTIRDILAIDHFDGRTAFDLQLCIYILEYLGDGHIDLS